MPFFICDNLNENFEKKNVIFFQQKHKVLVFIGTCICRFLSWSRFTRRKFFLSRDAFRHNFLTELFTRYYRPKQLLIVARFIFKLSIFIKCRELRNFININRFFFESPSIQIHNNRSNLQFVELLKLRLQSFSLLEFLLNHEKSFFIFIERKSKSCGAKVNSRRAECNATS